MPGFLRISHPDFPDKSLFRIRTNFDIPVAIARISSHFTSGFPGQIRISHPDKFRYPCGDCPDFFAFHIRISGQIRISHPNKFRYPRGDCPDFSAFHIRIFRTNPDFASGQIPISPKWLPGLLRISHSSTKAPYHRTVSHAFRTDSKLVTMTPN